MNRRKASSLTKNHQIFLVVAGIFFILGKYWYSNSTIEEWLFILKPTTSFVGFLTGDSFVFVPNQGYYFQDLDVLINKGCAGVNFWLLSFVLYYYQFVTKSAKIIYKIVALPLSLLLAYIFTIFINGSRIYTSIKFQNELESLLSIHHSIIHESIGVFTFLSFFILSSISINLVLNNLQKHEKFI
jgi:exosortase K